MASVAPARIWAMRAAFPALALLVIFFRLLPLETLPRSWAPPDLLMALAFAWSVRRPDYVPAISIALTMLMADLLFQRPPGLLAMLVVLGCEFLKSRVLPNREAAFAGEWFSVAVVIAAITLLNRLVLGIMGVGQAPLPLILFQMIMTIAAYPLVVLFSQSIMRVRKLSPAEAETLGSR